MTTSSLPRARHTPWVVTVALTVLGLALIAVAVVYFKDPAGALPSYFPGHAAGSAHKHVKHGLVATALAVVALAAAWLSTGTKRI